jgi:hypothetical protein
LDDRDEGAKPPWIFRLRRILEEKRLSKSGELLDRLHTPIVRRAVEVKVAETSLPKRVYRAARRERHVLAIMKDFVV